MSRSARATAMAVLVLAFAGAATACTGDDADTIPLPTDAPSPRDTGPSTTSARSTPFCAGMIDLAERLDSIDASDETPDDTSDDASDDAAALIRETYAELADVVPDEIRADFEAVRQLLVDQADGNVTTTTVVPISTIDVSDATAAQGDGEGAAISDSPTERLNDYVELVCRSTANNPGPPETEPL